jgi:hypothetical protein
MLHSRNRFESWLPALFDGEFDWDFLLPAWSGTKIQPMDFDAVIERRGKFLIFETKTPGKSVEVGQSITLTKQWEYGATIFLVSGKAPAEINGLKIYPGTKFNQETPVGFFDKIRKRPIGALPQADAFDVIYRARCWMCWASGDPIPIRSQWDRELWLWDNGGRP